MRIVHYVLCLDDDGHYTHATSRPFNSRAEASTYMIPIDKGRKPVIVSTGKPREN